MRFIFTLSVWGDWYINQFIRNALPSLKAHGNLDSIDYTIVTRTRPSDVERVRSALAGLVSDIKPTVTGEYLDNRAVFNPAVHCHKEEDRAAAGNDDVWLLLAPDMVWAEGTFAYYRRLFESGKKVIFRPLLRVDDTKAATIIDFRHRALAKVALEAEHDVVKNYYRAEDPQFSYHPEMLIWETSGGLINKTITAEVQVCLAKLELQGDHRLAPELTPDEMAVICDSDEGITLAITKTTGDLMFAHGSLPLTPTSVKNFLKRYPSPVSSYIASKSYRLHTRDIGVADEAEWNQVEQRADAFIKQVFTEGV